MILTLITLLLASLPDSVAYHVERMQHRDSLIASTAMLLPYRSEILTMADSFDVPPSLLAAVIQEESRFDPWAARTEPHYKRNRTVQAESLAWSRRHHGTPTAATELDDRSRSIGLMQVMGQVAREQGCQERYLSALHLPRNGIHHGAKRLRILLDRYRGDTLAAISAYNQGNNRKRKGLFVNARYVYRVTIAWELYRRILP